MIAPTAVIVVALAALALVAILAALLAWRVQRHTARLMTAAAISADKHAERTARSLARMRSQLANIQAGTERALWSLSRLDDRIDSARFALAERGAELDRHRARLVAARSSVEKTKAAVRLVTRAIELRRTILG